MCMYIGSFWRDAHAHAPQWSTIISKYTCSQRALAPDCKGCRLESCPVLNLFFADKIALRENYYLIHISNLRTCVFRNDGRPSRYMCMHISSKGDDVHVHSLPKYI